MNEEIHIEHETSDYQPSFVIKLMKFLVNLSWYMSIFGSILMVAVFIFYTAFDKFPTHLTLQVPLEVHFPDADENISVGDLAYPALVGFRGIVSFRAHEEYTPLAVNIIIAVVVLMAAMLVALYQLRLLMQTVSIGNPFHDKNPLRMRIIGFITLFWGPAVSLAAYLNAHQFFARGRLLSSSITNFEIKIAWQDQDQLMLMGIVILVIAQVFSVGVELQHEKDLTI